MIKTYSAGEKIGMAPSWCDMVREFHESFQIPIPDEPGIPHRDTIALRSDLLDEEHDELQDALEADDLEAVVKELCDLIYVCIGTSLSYGVDNLEQIFTEVHRSNMSKLGAEGLPLKRDDGKVLKGLGYTPPNVAQHLKVQWNWKSK